ncbi:hypothetical protein N7507_008463 [Penicillium longicatenatum]|nr:hypothetical protein N7507_008463 [Penicillium longicatenatum]
MFDTKIAFLIARRASSDDATSKLAPSTSLSPQSRLPFPHLNIPLFHQFPETNTLMNYFHLRTDLVPPALDDHREGSAK